MGKRREARERAVQFLFQHDLNPPENLEAELSQFWNSQRAAAIDGHDAPMVGLSCWTDAALFNEAGIPALCFGPGDIARAHSAEEWVERSDIERAARVSDGRAYALLARSTRWTPDCGPFLNAPP